MSHEKSKHNQNLHKRIREDEEVFDIIERKIESKRIKKKKEIVENQVDLNLEDVKIPEIERANSEDNFFDCFESKISDFEFDCRYIYNFNKFNIQKITCINMVNIPLYKPISEEVSDLAVSKDVSLKTISILNDPKGILRHSKELDDYDKLVYLGSFLSLKNLEVLKEVILLIKKFSELDLVGVCDICDKYYAVVMENLPENVPDEIMWAIFNIKRDVKILKMIKSTEATKEYLIYLNKTKLKEIQTSQCRCSSCIWCEVHRTTKMEILISSCKESYFVEDERDESTYEEFLIKKMELLDTNLDLDIIFLVVLGFNKENMLKCLESRPMSSSTAVLCILSNDDALKERLWKINLSIILKAIKTVQDIIFLLRDKDFNGYYKLYEDLNLYDITLDLSLKELMNHFKTEEEHTVSIEILDKENVGEIISSFFLPFKLIFLFEKIVTFRKIPNFTVYKVYDKICKYIVPDSFYDKLFSNQADHVLHLIRAKELFRLYQLLKDKNILFKAFKYLDKKSQCVRNKERTFKFNLLKSKFLVILNQPVEAYLAVQNCSSLDTCKILSYSDLNKSISELSKLKVISENFKPFLLSVELQICMKESLEVGRLFSQDSTVDKEIEILYTENSARSEETKLSYIRYLKYRDLKKAISLVEDFLRNKKKEQNDLICYESFIIRRKLKEVSYRSLYLNRRSDLLNQEIRYIENKECESDNKFLYLHLYKKALRNGHSMYSDYFLQESIKGNGDCLVILYILKQVSLDTLEFLYVMHSINGGFYWCRTRKMVSFRRRLLHTRELLEFDQNY